MTPVSAAELPTDVAALRAQLAQLQAAQAAGQMQINELQNELRLAERKRDLPAVSRLTAQISGLQSQLTSTAAEIAALIAQLTAKGYPPPARRPADRVAVGECPGRAAAGQARDPLGQRRRRSRAVDPDLS